MLCVKGGRT